MFLTYYDFDMGTGATDSRAKFERITLSGYEHFYLNVDGDILDFPDDEGTPRVNEFVKEAARHRTRSTRRPTPSGDGAPSGARLGHRSKYGSCDDYGDAGNGAAFYQNYPCTEILAEALGDGASSSPRRCAPAATTRRPRSS